MGLFGFGKRRKKKEEFLLQWQKTILPNTPDRLIMTVQQLRSATVLQIDNNIRIMKDCFALVEKTTKPETFFSRLKLMVEKAEGLAALEIYAEFAGIKYKSINAAYNGVFRSYSSHVRMFLIRYYSETEQKAETMKTEKGRLAKYQKFYDSLQEYYSCMNNEHIAYIESKYKMSIKL